METHSSVLTKMGRSHDRRRRGDDRGEKGVGLEGKGFGKHLVKHGEERKMVMGTEEKREEEGEDLVWTMIRYDVILAKGLMSWWQCSNGLTILEETQDASKYFPPRQNRTMLLYTDIIPWIKYVYENDVTSLFSLAFFPVMGTLQKRAILLKNVCIVHFFRSFHLAVFLCIIYDDCRIQFHYTLVRRE